MRRLRLDELQPISYVACPPVVHMGGTKHGVFCEPFRFYVGLKGGTTKSGRAKRNGRRLVVGTRLAYLLREMREKVPVLPDVLKDGNVKVYFRLCKSCTFSEKDYYPWEREFMGNMVTYEEMARRPGEHVLHMNFNQLIELVYLQPKGADFIYSSSEHFLEGEGNEEERKRWEAWMRHFGIRFHKAHCSGHASREDLQRVIEEINPEIVVPIHTSRPEEFKKFHKNVKIVGKGETIRI